MWYVATCTCSSFNSCIGQLISYPFPFQKILLRNRKRKPSKPETFKTQWPLRFCQCILHNNQKQTSKVEEDDDDEKFENLQIYFR